MVGHRNVYLPDLQITDTSLFSITLLMHSPADCIVNDTVKVTHPCAIAQSANIMKIVDLEYHTTDFSLPIHFASW